MAFFSVFALFLPIKVLSAPAAQSGTMVTPQLFLLPVESTTVELQTHTVDLNVSVDSGQGGLFMEVAAMYRFSNPGDEAVNLLLRLAPDPASSASQPTNVTLVNDAQPVTLQPAENGGSTGQITIAGGARADVLLAYTLPLDSRLPLIRYDVRGLADWPGQVSMRIGIALPASIPPESWLRITPEDWRYQTAQENGVKWLYDQQLPDQPIMLQFVHPTVWRELTAAQQAVTGDPSPANYIGLGARYHELFDQSVTAQTPTERFFAHALAAYAAGIDSSNARNSAPQEVAPLHAGAATLYRTRVVEPDGAVNPEYAELMVQSARAAVQGLPANDAKQAEMLQWQAEGLNILLDAANDRRDWQTALTFAEQLSALPAGVVDPARLEEVQRTLKVQQALQLLEEDDRDAAIALAGPEIVDATLAPPASAQSLFTSWQVTMTHDLDRADLIFVARPHPDHVVEASQVLADQVAKWKETRATRKTDIKLEDVQLGGGVQGLRLSISLPENTESETLAALVGPAPQLALLQSVLMQVGTESEQDGKLIWRQVTLRQPLDLRGVGDQWGAMAANLSREAAQLEQAGASQDPEGALRARIQAVNFRNAARTWEELSQSSWVVTTLQIPAGVRTLSRAWLTTPSSPPQILEFSTSTISGARLLIAVMIVVIGLLMLTALLWWLL